MASAVVGALRVVLGLDSAAFTNGLSGARQSLAAAGKEFQTIGRNMSTWVTAPMLAVGGALAATTHRIAGQAEEMRRLAQVSNAGFEEFQRLAHAAQTVGIESDKLADIYKDVNDRVGDFIQTGGGPMADFFENIAPQVGLTADQFARLSGPEALQAYYDALVQAGVSQADMTFYLEAMASDVTALIPLLENGGQAFRELGQEAAVISDQDATSLQEYNDAMRRMGEAIEAVAIAFATSGILDQLVGLVDGAAQMLRGLEGVNPEIVQFGVVFAGVSAAIGPVLVVLGTFVTVIAGLSAPVLAAAAAIAAITAAVIAFWPEIQTLAGVITEFLANAWRQFEAAWDGMTAKVGEVKQAIADFAASIPQFFAELPAQMLQIGNDIIQGLWNGLQAKWTETQQWMGGLGDQITGFFTNPLGIHSPSRVMHEIGVFTMQGLNNGLQSYGSTVESTATDIAHRVGSAFQGALTGAKTVGQAIADLTLELGKMFLSQGFQALSGMGGGLGFIGNILGGILGFSRGGTILPGGSGGIDSQLVMFRKSPNERVDITKPGQTLTAGEGPSRLHITTGVAVDGQGSITSYVRSVVQDGIEVFNDTLPARVQQINADPRVR